MELVANRHPVLLRVVLPPKQLQLPRAGRETLQEAVHLVGLVACVADLGDEDVAVDDAVVLLVALRVALDAHEAVLL